MGRCWVDSRNFGYKLGKFCGPDSRREGGLALWYYVPELFREHIFSVLITRSEQVICEVMEVLINLIAAIISQFIGISSHHIEHL